MNSIRRQLTRRLLGATLTLLGLGLVALLAAAGYALVRQFDANLRTKALAVSTLTLATHDSVRVEFSDRFLRGFDDDDSSDFFQVWDAEGKTIARSESVGKRDLPRRAGSFGKPKYWLLTLPNGEAGRAVGFVFKPKVARGVDTPELVIVVASERDSLEEGLALLLALGVGTALLLAGVTLWLVPRVLARGLAPLDALGQQAARINAGSLATRFPATELPSELQPIAGRLNELLARLEEAFERERRYSADLAHELRTPLAELRSLAECALKWPETRDLATDRETLAIAQQMEALVTQMLALARGEQHQLTIQCEPLALMPLVEAVWAPFAERAAARGLQIELVLEPITAVGDPVLLRSVLANLFDNAVDHAPSGEAVSIWLAATPRGAELHVANPAGALTAADLEKLFERFWRKETARSGGQHAGLGLSLARTFATAMGWTLIAELDDRGWVRFTLSEDKR